MNDIKLLEGISLSFCRFEMAHAHTHHPAEHIVEINYCRDGRIGWDLGDGNRIFLGPGDFCIHTLRACADSRVTLPSELYEGLSLTLDLNALKSAPPALFEDCGIDAARLVERFCSAGTAACFSGTPETEAIFSRFYSENSPAYHRLKALEIILFLCSDKAPNLKSPERYDSDQVETIKKVHDYLLDHLCERETIESLAKRFAMNPTTLKATFKAVYGDSIASHTKVHRMESAAKMLLSTCLPLNEIASAVGYESQSKFSAAFREIYNMLPSEYRRQQ